MFRDGGNPTYVLTLTSSIGPTTAQAAVTCIEPTLAIPGFFPRSNRT